MNSDEHTIQITDCHAARRVGGGKPVIRGTRISVEFLLNLLSSGMSVEDVLDDYRHLTRDDILAALHYAENLVKHEEVLLSSQMASMK